MSADWTDPREDCPECGSHLLIDEGDRFCSFIECDYGLEPDPPLLPRPEDQ